MKEKSKIPVTVSFDGGIEKYSGLLDVALESGHVVKPTNGWYASVDFETGEVGEKHRLADIMNAEFWDPILSNQPFNNFIQQKYGMAYGNIMGEIEVLEEKADEA